MELLILGMLLLKKSTIYEIRKHVERNFTSMSSNSMGSIQAAIKKLLQNGMIIFNERVENSVNKKVYEITDAGRAYFYSGISKPMAYKEKNMELVKLFFMGFTEKNKRPELMEAYLSELLKELAALEQIRQTVEALPEIDDTYVSYVLGNPPVSTFSLREIQEIAFYQSAVLDLSITKIKVEIEWFKAFIKQAEAK